MNSQLINGLVVGFIAAHTAPKIPTLLWAFRTDADGLLIGALLAATQTICAIGLLLHPRLFVIPTACVLLFMGIAYANIAMTTTTVPPEIIQAKWITSVASFIGIALLLTELLQSKLKKPNKAEMATPRKPSD